MTLRKEIFIRIERCMGCFTCQLSCSIEHSESKSLYSLLLQGHRPRPRLYVEKVSPNHSVPIVCRQCEDAPCLHACIAGAIRRNKEQVVITDSDRCIGCWTCVMTCPFGVIGRHMEEHKAYKCDRCPELEVPTCVSSCPTGALIYESTETFAQKRRNETTVEVSRERES